MPGLLDNTTLTLATNAVGATGQICGHAFTVSAPTEVTGFRWYALSTANADKPDAITLWRNDTNTIVHQETVIANASGTGWQTEPLGDPITLLTGVAYTLGWHCTNKNRPLQLNKTLDAPPAPYALEATYRLWANVPNRPTTGWAHVTGVDLETGTIGPVPPDEPPDQEPDPGTLDPGGSLAYWLHQDTENPDSLPKLTYARLAEMIVQADANTLSILGVLGAAGSSGGATAMGRLALILALAEAIPGIAANLLDLWEKLSPGTSTLEDIRADIAGLNAQTDTLQGRDSTPIPGNGWTLAGEVVGSGAGTTSIPADRYVFTITNPEVLRAGMTIDGIHYFGHRGWWAPLNIDLVGNHRPFVAIKSEWYEVGQRLPGAIWHVDPEIEWTLQAFDYTAPPP